MSLVRGGFMLLPCGKDRTATRLSLAGTGQRLNIHCGGPERRREPHIRG